MVKERSFRFEIVCIVTPPGYWEDYVKMRVPNRYGALQTRTFSKDVFVREGAYFVGCIGTWYWGEEESPQTAWIEKHHIATWWNIYIKKTRTYQTIRRFFTHHSLRNKSFD